MHKQQKICLLPGQAQDVRLWCLADMLTSAKQLHNGKVVPFMLSPDDFVFVVAEWDCTRTVALRWKLALLPPEGKRGHTELVSPYIASLPQTAFSAAEAAAGCASVHSSTQSIIKIMKELLHCKLREQSTPFGSKGETTFKQMCVSTACASHAKVMF